MVAIRLNDSAVFSSDPGQRILDAAAAAGHVIGYSCKNGRCSSCRCRLLSGDTEALTDELGLTAEERAAGWILSCVRTARSDVVLEVEDLLEVVPPPVRTLPSRILSLEPLAADVVKVMLRLPPSADFQFLPGQYLDVTHPIDGSRRSYSIANASAADKKLELHVRRVDQGVMSRYWFSEAKVGDLLRLHGTLGTFVLRSSSDLDVVFLATGTGIAPVKSMLESLAVAEGQKPKSVRVYWGGRSEQDLYWDPRGAGAPIIYRPVLSRAGPEWGGARGHIQDVLLSEQPDLSRVAVYACGSDAMIHSAKKRLTENGLPPKRFYSDAFVSSSPNPSIGNP